MGNSIKNAVELKAEIARLKMATDEQSIALKARFNSPSAIFHAIGSAFPKSAEGSKHGGFFNQDFLGLISRIALPLTLNKTLFKNSNFIIKTLVGVLSQKASHFISEDAVTGLWGKVKSAFEKKDKKDVKTDYGIPPLSESY